MLRRFMFSALIFMMLFLAACQEQDEKTDEPENETIPVELAEVESGDLVVKKYVYSHTAPAKQTPVMLEAPAEITELFVENGDEVEKDDKIATIKTPMGSQTIYAPAKGRIAKLTAQTDEMQSNEDPLAMIIDITTIHMTFDVTAANRAHFKKDDKATIHIDDRKYSGTVLAVDVLPGESGQYPIAVELEPEEEEILPGTAAKLEIADKRVKDTLIVPTEAIVTESDETFVFIVKDNQAKKVAVEVKETQTETTAVDGDLKDGDKVITKGQFTLSDGVPVDVKDGDDE